MKLGQFAGGGGSNRRDAHHAERADILKLLEEIIEERGDAVWTGEDQPVVNAQAFNRFLQRLQLIGRHDFNRGNLQNVGAAFEQFLRKLAGLSARAGDDNPLAEQGPVFEPIEFVSQPHNIADDRHRRRRKFFLCDPVCDGGECSFDGLLPAGGSPAHHCHRRVRSHALGHQRSRELANTFHSHQYHFSARHFGQWLPIQRRIVFRGIFVAGNDREAGAKVAMGEWNTSVVGCCDDRRDARDDFEWNLGLGQCLGFFAAAPEDVRVAALEANHGFAFTRFRNQQRIEFVLWHSVIFGAFAAVNDLGGPRSEPEQIRINERVVHDDIGATEQFRAAHGEESAVAWSGTDQIDRTFRFHREILYRANAVRARSRQLLGAAGVRF